MSEPPHYGAPLPPQGRPGPLGRSRRKPFVLALVFVLLLAAGGTAYFLTTGKGKDSEASAKQGEKGPAAGGLSWSAAARTTPVKGSNMALGTWFTDDTVVKAEPNTVTAYDLATGEKKWSFILADTLCAVSGNADADTAVIVTQFDGACTRPTAFDLRTGNRAWTKDLMADGERAGPELKPAKWQALAQLRVAVGGGYALLTWATGEQTFRLGDGKKMTSVKRKACGVTAAAGGKELLSATSCGGRGEVRSLNPADPKRLKWKWTAPKGVWVRGILSTTPAVLQTDKDTDASSELTVLAQANGREARRIPYGNDWALGSCLQGGEGCVGGLVSGDTFYVAGKGMTAAYSLNTGNELWVHKDDPNRKANPIAVRDGELVTYVQATAERPGHLSFVTAATGRTARKQELAMSIRKREYAMESVRTATPYLRSGRFLLVADGMLDSEDDDVILAIAPGGTEPDDRRAAYSPPSSPR
ncbi:outer membrane protein assembly factor BamB family protein [Streptomyces varsoviensis]|uniref:outer membrane protein assembly factor BamB family protein n=1 Tax=Streptomyces varsoviensis TaxID=67373 RepID=UPI000AB85814|nr:PQQ-binding-like beta-propeller repeat protein [Streptomyces varsoviensis]